MPEQHANLVSANDFSRTGTCNYYLTQDKFLESYAALPFQVSKTIDKMKGEIQYILFQKQSPYLDDMNTLIHQLEQMGIAHDDRLKYFIPNATKCNSIDDVYKSHARKKGTVIMEVNDIYGLLALLGLGICLALIPFIAEMILLVSKNLLDNMKVASVINCYSLGFQQLKAKKRRGRGIRAWH